MLYTFGTLLAMTEAPVVIASGSAAISVEGMRLLRRGLNPELAEGLLAMTDGGATVPGSLYGILYSYREP